MADSQLTSPYIPNTVDEQAAMLQAIGVDSVDDLFQDIPAEFRNPGLNMPAPLSEMEVLQELQRLSERNLYPGRYASFLGAGVYRHFTPSVVSALVSRGEYLTSYTPYQAEASQGTLQSTFEFQTMSSQIMGMEVANAGMYDGATSLAEAALMACRITKRGRVAIVDTVAPNYAEVVRTYAEPQGIEAYTVSSSVRELQPGTACLLVQSPNFFGYLEDMGGLTDVAHNHGALMCTSADPVAMSMFKSPGAYGVDIATAEGQALGVPPSFGGPYVGIFTCKQEFFRQMPGRIAGRTTDTQGRTGYVLTLQTREQHIRRERATSNICTSTALIGLMATIYVACMGKQGLRRVAEICYHKAHYAAGQIAEIPGYSLPMEGTFFQEFVVRCPRPPAEINAALQDRGIIGGLDVSDLTPNGMLICVTEVNSRREIDSLVSALKEIG
jgi:glycine dehydrogenase subunit 1